MWWVVGSILAYTGWVKVFSLSRGLSGLLCFLFVAGAPLPALARPSPRKLPVAVAKERDKPVRACTWHGSVAQMNAPWVLTSFRHATHWNRMEWDGTLNLRDLLREAPALDEGVHPRRLAASYAPPLLDGFLQEANLYWEIAADDAFQILTPPGGLVFCSDCRKRGCRMHARWFDPAGSGNRTGFVLGRLAGAPELGVSPAPAAAEAQVQVQAQAATGPAPAPAMPSPPEALVPPPPLRASLPPGYVDPDRLRAHENQRAQTAPSAEIRPAILEGAIPL